MFKQCKMENKSTGWSDVHTAWIPEQFAKVGKVLRLKFEEGWDEGWVVTEVGTQMTEEWVMEYSQDYKYQRKASDV
jgi:hypothetical protein